MSIFDDLVLPKTVFETHSDISGHITVVDYGKTRRLRVQKLTQSVNWDSPVVKNMYYGRSIRQLKDFNINLSNILILGLGGGTLQHLFSREFPGINILSVEFDPIIVDIAHNYFELASIPNHHLIVDDALKILASPEDYGIQLNSFDAIFVDIYCGEKFPELGNSGTFMSGLQKILKDKGVAIFNRIYWEHHQYEVNNFIDSLDLYFSNIKSIIVAGKTNSDYVLIFANN